MNITLYTTPTCPDCLALKAWLASRGLRYQKRNLEVPEIQAEAKLRYGLRVAPITVVDDQFFYGTFDEQRPRLDLLLDSRA